MAQQSNSNGLSGTNVIVGTDANEKIHGGSGSDLLDGGRGNDTVNGNSGDDVAVYIASDNTGSTDIYTGGSGKDTLRLALTRAEWMNAAVQSDIANYLAFLPTVIQPVNGQAKNTEFKFSAFDLRVAGFEKLEVTVDGVAIDPADQAVSLADDALSAGENTPSIAINVLANDSVPDLIKNLTYTAPAHGTVQLNLDAAASKAEFAYTPDATHFDYLAVGETATDSFTYTVTDADGDESTATVTVTITGSNDGPVIVSGVVAGVLTEGDSIADLSSTGTIQFQDLDLSDVHTVAVGAPVVTGAALALGELTASVAEDATDADNQGQINWTFTANDAALQSLAAGQTISQIYTLTLSDSAGASVTQDVTITLTGTNDAPTIVAAATSASAAVQEIADNGAGENTAIHAVTGAVVFADVDVIDTHSASFTPVGSDYLGVFSLDTVNQDSDSIGWHFSVADGALDSLSAGQTLTQDYTVTVDDGNGGTVNQVVSVTLTGSNSAPTIVAAATTASAAVQEIADNAAGENIAIHAATGSIAFVDVDTTDTHSVSFTPAGSDYLGDFSLEAVNQNGDSFGWHFSVADGVLDSLQAGQTLTQDYTVTIDDSHGGTVDQVVSVTLTGTNDAPTVNPASLTTGKDTAKTITVASLLANAQDVDAGDVLSLAAVGTASHGTVVINADQTVTYAPAAGYAGVDSFSYTVTDDHGGETTSIVNVDVIQPLGAPTLAVGSSTTLNPTDGSAIKTTMSLQAGDVVTFNWDFVAHDYMPYNDFSFATVNQTAFFLAGVQVVGDYGSTGWKTFSYTAPTAGSYTFGMGQFDVNDTALDSHLLVDNLRVNGDVVQSFESGSFSSWSTNGNVSVAVSHDGVSPTHGTYLAWLNSSPSSEATVEDFLGLAAGRLKNIAKSSGAEFTLIVVPVAVTTSPDDNPDQVFLTITGAPAGSVFNHGAYDSGLDAWKIDAADIGGNLTVTPPSDFSGSFSLTMTATSVKFASGESVTTAPQSLSVTVDPASVNLLGTAAADTLNGGTLNDVLDGAGGADILTGGNGNDLFIFSAGAANGDAIIDFNGAGSAAGDTLQFTGYGTVIDGASFVQIDATHWQVTSADGQVQDVIVIGNAASVDSTDWQFV